MSKNKWTIEYRKEYLRQWYQRNKEKVAIRGNQWRKDNRVRNNEIKRKATRNLRITVLTHYSNGKLECLCCGVKHVEFLTIDHINGGGTKHRKEIGVGGSSIYQWLKNNNYPKGFQTLCFNCNCSTGMLGYCPHNKEVLIVG